MRHVGARLFWGTVSLLILIDIAYGIRHRDLFLILWGAVLLFASGLMCLYPSNDSHE